jgi:ubiquinone/menaquinone biosynthesis C-methylase UbiE
MINRKFEVRQSVDRGLAIAYYRELAKSYDATCALTEPIRRKAIALLNLQPGEVVLDIASGTGKSLPLLSAGVGPKGRVIAIEQSPEMADLSSERVDILDLTNVKHILSSVEEADIQVKADAVLFHYTHDVFRTPAALNNVFLHLRPGARIVVAGCKNADGWRAIFNPWFQYRTRGYLSTFEGLDAPWSHLVQHAPNFEVVSEYFLGSGYLGVGSVPTQAQT